MSEETIAIEVADDSILARKQIVIRPIQQMKQKHLRSLRKVLKMGQQIDPAALDADQVFELTDALNNALAGLLMGWTPDDIDELSLEEMLMVYQQIGSQTRHALPKARSSSFTPRSPQTTARRGRTGSTRSS